MKVLIIGAGPTGLTAALKFASKGIICRIVERQETPSGLSRAVGLMPAMVDALQPLGAGDAIRAEAMPLRKIHFLRAGKELMFIDNPESKFGDQVVMGLPQDRTEEILRDALNERGVHVEYGLSVDKVTTTDSQATAQFSNGSTEEYDWIIAANGIRSSTREQLGIAYPGFDLDEEWSIADVDVEGKFDPDTITLDVQAPGHKSSLILPIEPHRVRVVSSTPDALGALSQPLTVKRIRREGTFRISVRQAETYRKGRVLLAGDAAHCHSPVGGKGMNLGMADAIAAASAIMDGTVDSYSDARHKVGLTIMTKTELARKLITSHSLSARITLWIITKMITHIPSAHRAFMKLLTNIK